MTACTSSWRDHSLTHGQRLSIDEVRTTIQFRHLCWDFGRLSGNSPSSRCWYRTRFVNGSNGCRTVMTDLLQSQRLTRSLRIQQVHCWLYYYAALPLVCRITHWTPTVLPSVCLLRACKSRMVAHKQFIFGVEVAIGNWNSLHLCKVNLLTGSHTDFRLDGYVTSLTSHNRTQ